MTGVIHVEVYFELGFLQNGISNKIYVGDITYHRCREVPFCLSGGID